MSEVIALELEFRAVALPSSFTMNSMSAKVFLKIKSLVISKNSGSQACFQSLYFAAIGKMPKFMEPTLREAISGLARTAARSLSSRVMPSPPPVDTFTTASVDCLMIGRNSINSSGRGSGLPSFGLRA
jgi:hypothetical protein